MTLTIAPQAVPAATTLPSDPRSSITRARLRAALVTRCQQQPFADISVAALCREAGVARKTLYAHYPDVPTIATEIVRELGLELAAGIEDDHLRIPHSASGIFPHVVTNLSTRRELMLVICRRFPVDAVRRGCMPVIATLFDRAETLNGLPPGEPIARQFWCETIASSMATMFSIWAGRGFKDKPQVFAEIGTKYLAPGIDLYWREQQQRGAP